ncbi:MAG: Asp-tRNA(Asn)/Glu-tRNA(Gln) amidotransferase subunit GatC [Polyangiaceae bacterium]|jgi:aspartyl-tRNA(Asn)/glutamyl-tRNA(Gln) amidotransferase subunit C|nr:Asp-tRNA(Asn)/Glu-tRNA(Gln) amidotransferase subunit GatC [Polyangiaceae bacterium]MBK8936086.1 Asp-tRNA(Asn)/Glu-tRNA(Gln) amidotransferase subunit GatC [Polyangiaceae bacterium]
MAVRVDDALVSRLASLANLELSLDEARALTRDLGRIVEYVAILEQADVEGVEPLASVRAERERRRADVPLPSLDRSLALREAPREADGGFRVPPFVDEG